MVENSLGLQLTVKLSTSTEGKGELGVENAAANIRVDNKLGQPCGRGEQPDAGGLLCVAVPSIGRTFTTFFSYSLLSFELFQRKKKKGKITIPGCILFREEMEQDLI